MSLADVPLERITEGHIRSLIDNATPESAVLDYKRETYKQSSDLAGDVCAFANTRGGDLVIGVEASGGIPVGLMSFTGDADAETLRLEQMIRDNTEPRISGFTTRAIPISAGGAVIIVRVRKSFNAPHRTKTKKFYVRSSAGNFEPDVTELRRLFIEAPQLVEQVRAFRGERLAAIVANDTPVAMDEGPKLVTHVLSLPAFADQRLTEVVDVVSGATHMPLPPMGPGANHAVVNLDGLATFPRTEEPYVKGYAQLFRRGVIEGVMQPDFSRGHAIIGPALANTTVATIKQHAATLVALDAGAPLYAFVALVNARGTAMNYSVTGAAGQVYATGPYGRDLIALPEVQLGEDAGETAALLRPVLNMLWNAYTLPKCETYDGQGKWIGTA